MRALILTGPPGAGKTSVLGALTSLLAEADVRHAALEMDALAVVHPWPDDEAAFAHLELLAGSFCRRGYPLLLATATVESAAYLRRLRGAVGTGDVRVVRLEAPPALLRRRIEAREPPEWPGLPRLLAAVAPLADAIAALQDVDLALSTDGASPHAVAAAVRDALVRAG